MSRCGRTSSIEALVLGELSAPEALELRSHAHACGVCRHELRWAETEKSLFSQRAVRDEVRGLWAQTQWAKPAARRSLGPMFAAAIAAVLLVGVLLRPQASPKATAPAWEPDELLMTLDEAALMTPANPDDFSSAQLEASVGACLMMTPGQGGVLCPPGPSASFTDER